MESHSQKIKSTDRFARRVSVWTPDGQYLFCAHAEQAHRMVSEKLAEIEVTEKKKVIRITFLRPAASFARRTTLRPSATARLGPNPDVFREVVGYQEQRLSTFTFRRIPKDDHLRIIEERRSLLRYNPA